MVLYTHFVHTFVLADDPAAVPVDDPIDAHAAVPADDSAALGAVLDASGDTPADQTIIRSRP